MSDLNSSFMTLHRQEQRLCAVLSDVDTKSLPLSLPRVLSIVDRHRVRPMHGHRKSGRGTSCLTLDQLRQSKTANCFGAAIRAARDGMDMVNRFSDSIHPLTWLDRHGRARHGLRLVGRGSLLGEKEWRPRCRAGHGSLVVTRTAMIRMDARTADVRPRQTLKARVDERRDGDDQTWPDL